MKIIRTALTLTLTTSLLVNSSGYVYALRPMSEAVQVQADNRGGDGKDKTEPGRHKGPSRRRLLLGAAASTAAFMLSGCQYLDSLSVKQVLSLSSGRFCLYEYLQYFTDVKVPLREPEKPSVAVKNEDKEGGVSITAQHYKNALDKSLSYGERTKLFSELYYAYDEGDRATKKEVLYIIDAVIKKIKGNRLNQAGVTKLLIAILGYDTPAREELMNLVCDAQTSISEPLRAFIYTCLKHKVSWFTRFYPQDFRTIIEHRVTKETHPRRAIYIGPVEDEEGNFERDKAEFRKLLRAGYDISYHEASSFEDVVRALQEEKGAGPADLIIFAGHGSKDSIFLELPKGAISIMNEYQFIKYGLNECLKKGGTVILDSCSTGEEEATGNVSDAMARILNKTEYLPVMNLANMLARVFKQAAHVFAATKETKKCEIKLGKDKEVTGAEYDCPTYDAAEALRKLKKKPESAHIQQALASSA